MKSSALIDIAVRSILRNKMRTALTMLGIVIGVAAVIIMVAIGQGAQNMIEAQIRGLGTNMIMIMPGSSSQGGVSQGAGTFNRLTLEDAEKIEREAVTLAAVSPIITTFAQAIGGEGNWRTRVYGVSTSYQTIRDWKVKSGEYFNSSDLRTNRRVAVLGKTVADQLFPDGNAVGQQIQIRNVPFRIVGVLESRGQSSMGDQDDVIVMPYTTANSRLAGHSRISQILASTWSSAEIPRAEEEIRAILRESHRLGVNDEDDFTIRNQDEIASAAQSTTEVMTLLLAAIASISLLVGGIGIMNIMLVSVTERTREIGIRMAIGARGGDVLAQFLVESVVISIAGGLVGLAIGYIGSKAVGHFTGWLTAVPVDAALLAIGFSAAVGVFFGLYPARKAAALDPIQALRHE